MSTRRSDFEGFDILDSFNPFNVLSFDSFNSRSVFLLKFKHLPFLRFGVGVALSPAAA
jgi:hypothetical protein